MNYIKQFLILLLFALAGEVVNELVPLPIPACIWALVFLFIALWSGVLKLEKIRDAGRFLVVVQPVMFVPAGVGLMVIWGEIKSSIIQYAILIVATTFIVMIFTGWVTQFVIRRQNGGKDSNES